MPEEARKDLFDIFKKFDQLLLKLGIFRRILLSQVP